MTTRRNFVAGTAAAASSLMFPWLAEPNPPLSRWAFCTLSPVGQLIPVRSAV